MTRSRYQRNHPADRKRDERSCGRKRHAFSSNTIAVTFANVLSVQHSNKLKPYRCLACGRWHLCKDRT